MAAVDPRRIVVGVDGSLSARHAARWAAADADRRNLSLHLVHVISAYTRPGVSFGPAPEIYRTVRRDAEHALDQARTAAREAAPGLVVTTEWRQGTANTMLIERSKRALFMVIGSCGLGGFSGMVVGSTAVALATRGHCPVVVVRGRGPDAAPPTRGPVLVGVDGTPASRVAIDLAYEEAWLRGTDLVAVHAWQDVGLATTAAAHLGLVEWEAVEERQRTILHDSLGGYQEKYPDVPVSLATVQDRPVEQLLDYAMGAQLVVVGSHGHNGLRGALLGSTSQALIYHAPCPVLVARPDSLP